MQLKEAKVVLLAAAAAVISVGAAGAQSQASGGQASQPAAQQAASQPQTATPANQAPAQPQAQPSATAAAPTAASAAGQSSSAAPAASKETVGQEIKNGALWPVREAEKGVRAVQNAVDPDAKAKVVPEGRARQAALKAVAGTVVKSELETKHGKSVYEFKIRPQSGGELKEVHIDAATGALIGDAKKAD